MQTYQWLDNREMASPKPKQLFNYCLEESRAAQNSKRLFFYRLNRWRFDPFDAPRAWKSGSRGATSFFKFRYAFGLFVVYRLTLHCKSYLRRAPRDALGLANHLSLRSTLTLLGAVTAHTSPMGREQLCIQLEALLSVSPYAHDKPMKGYLDEDTPLSSKEQKPIRRLPLMLGFVSLLELAFIACSLFLRPSYANDCPGSPLGTWSLALLIFSLVHLAYSYALDWSEQTCPSSPLVLSFLRGLQVAALLAAAGWVGAGHVWAYRAWNCTSVNNEFAQQVLTMGVCDAAVVFCVVIAALGWLRVGESEDEKERRRLFR